MTLFSLFVVIGACWMISAYLLVTRSRARFIHKSILEWLPGPMIRDLGGVTVPDFPLGSLIVFIVSTVALISIWVL